MSELQRKDEILRVGCSVETWEALWFGRMTTEVGLAKFSGGGELVMRKLRN